jgi:hypothetical protein
MMNIKRTALLAEDAAAAEDRDEYLGREDVLGAERRGAGRTFRPTPSGLASAS